MAGTPVRIRTSASTPTRVPANYGFPFEPYGIQRELMSELHATAASGGVGMFESPTGTVRCDVV